MDPATAKGDAIGSDSDQQEKRVDRHVAVQLRNVHKTYLLGLEGVPALRGVDVTINKGEFVVVLGKSGELASAESTRVRQAAKSLLL